MVVRRIKRSAVGGSLLLMSLFMLVMQGTHDSLKRTHRTLDYALYWTHSLPLKGDRYPGKYLPYFVFPVDHERLVGIHKLEETQALVTRRHYVTPLDTGTSDISDLQYTDRAPPLPPFDTLGPAEVWSPRGPQVHSVQEYFGYLHSPQASCRKVVRMGGTPTCKANVIDGHKYLCLDASMGLAAPKPAGQCLTLSFGVQFDTTFEEAVVNLPCEVHMFDVIDFKPTLPKERKHVYFHNEGLADSPRMNHFNNINITARMDTLSNHVNKLGLNNRLIHVLKVDIENSEWEAFRDIARDPIFDLVGQVAMEVHQSELVIGPTKHSPPTVPREKWMEALQSRYEVLRMIEARGFRRVLYWDNVQDEFPLLDDLGVRYETSGELLYINTHWSNATFMRDLKTRRLLR